jgi:hypothetical protein
MNAKIRKVNGVDVLEIQVPINARPSKSGKTTVIASTNGNQTSSLQHDGFNVVIGVNAYIPKVSAVAAD